MKHLGNRLAMDTVYSTYGGGRAVPKPLIDHRRNRNMTQDAMNEVANYVVRYDRSYPHFGIVSEPQAHSQHPNQQAGLDLYVSVVNFGTGENCFKKLYENKRGLHFKHTGYSPMYLDDFDTMATVVPFQVIFAQLTNTRTNAK